LTLGIRTLSVFSAMATLLVKESGSDAIRPARAGR
jgi:hypothetical protein